MATVSFKGATRIYPGSAIPAVERLDLDIQDGEFMVLVGPSGSGKSTAVRMLAGLEEVNEGSIYIGDRDVTDNPPKDRDIAMVFQNYALYPHMTVAENMGFALKMHGIQVRERLEDGCGRYTAAATADDLQSRVAQGCGGEPESRSCHLADLDEARLRRLGRHVVARDLRHVVLDCARRDSARRAPPAVLGHPDALLYPTAVAVDLSVQVNCERGDTRHEL
jgi:ABC-type sugar transport system ATPase subunit